MAPGHVVPARRRAGRSADADERVTRNVGLRAETDHESAVGSAGAAELGCPSAVVALIVPVAAASTRSMPSEPATHSSDPASAGAANVGAGNGVRHSTSPLAGASAAATQPWLERSLDSRFTRCPSVAIGPPSGPPVGPADFRPPASGSVIRVCHSLRRRTRSQAKMPSLLVANSRRPTITGALLKSKPVLLPGKTWSCQMIAPVLSRSAISEQVPGFEAADLLIWRPGRDVDDARTRVELAGPITPAGDAATPPKKPSFRTPLPLPYRETPSDTRQPALPSRSDSADTSPLAEA